MASSMPIKPKRFLSGFIGKLVVVKLTSGKELKGYFLELDRNFDFHLGGIKEKVKEEGVEFYSSSADKVLIKGDNVLSLEVPPIESEIEEIVEKIQEELDLITKKESDMEY